MEKLRTKYDENQRATYNILVKDKEELRFSALHRTRQVSGYLGRSAYKSWLTERLD